MPTFHVTETRLDTFKFEDGSAMPDKVFRLYYDIPDVPEMDGHVHIIPFAAVANYQLEEGGGTVDEALDFFIRDRMQAGYEQNQIATSFGRVIPGAATRAEAARERLERVNTYVRDLAVAEAEIGLPESPDQLMRLVAESLLRGMNTGQSMAHLRSARGSYQSRGAETLVGFEVSKEAPGWKQLQEIAATLDSEMEEERTRQVDARWGQMIKQVAWMTHLKMTGS